MKSSAQPKRTIGAMLADQRERLGIPIELAAKESRIRAQRLREIEQDDFSELSNASYARMFLIAYAKYLGIPREDLDEYLPEQGLPGAENYQYIHGASNVLPTIRHEPRQSLNPRKRLVITLIALFLVMVSVTALGIGIYLAVMIPRITTSADGTEATAEPGPTTGLPVIPPGAETVQSVAFQSSISITVSEMPLLHNTSQSPELTLPEPEPVDLPAETQKPQAAASAGDTFADDVNFLLGPAPRESSEPNN
jgi:cytoskeletal protein RodZ